MDLLVVQELLLQMAQIQHFQPLLLLAAVLREYLEVERKQTD